MFNSEGRCSQSRFVETVSRVGSPCRSAAQLVKAVGNICEVVVVVGDPLE